MGMFKPGNLLQRFLIRSHEFEPDYPLDHLIRDALFEDSLARLSDGAWERLRRQAMIEQKYRKNGMWLLNEPLRDPPEAPPLQLNYQEYKRALRVYSDRGLVDSRREIMMYKNTLWGGMMPTFSGLLNW